ncbi:NIPA-like protein 2 isoform X1 [Pomacea canaliculata]|nr:NIPA-like protein 2 isoform X1 [Pomacea canaliculata]
MSTPKEQEREEPLKYQDLFLGSGLAVCGNVLISISLNVQKYTHMKNAQKEEFRHYTKDPLWWFGLFLMGLGEIGNFTAYGFAPASLVAPLGTTTVVANLFLAAIFLKEKIRPENLFGCALAIIGAFLIVTFSSQHEIVMSAREVMDALNQVPFIVYVCIEVGALGLLFFLLYGLKLKHVVILLLITSIAASFTVISAKALSGMVQISFGGFSQFRHPVVYAMLVMMVGTAILQIKYLNQAMKNFASTVVVPTNFVFFTISAIVAGVVFYKEFHGMTSMDLGMFIFGCILSFVAVYFITSSGLFGSTKQQEGTQQHLTADLIPSWMLANVHVGHVQPKGHIEHLVETAPDTSDQTPILAAAQASPGQLADSPDVEVTVGLTSQVSPNAVSAAVDIPVQQKSYGTTK